MKKKVVLAILFLISINISYATWPSDVTFTASAKTEGKYTVVTIRIPAGNKNCSFKVNYLSCFDGSSICPGSTYITYYFDGQRCAGKLLGQRGGNKVNTSYKAYPNDLTYELCFERIPATITSIGLHLAYEYSNGWSSNSSVSTCDNLPVHQTFPSVPKTSFTSESTIKNYIDNQDDGIVGIYEGTVGNKYKLACVKNQDGYQLIFLRDNTINSPWRIGEVKATLIPTSTVGFFKANWYMQDKSPNDDCYVTFSGSTMDVLLDGTKDIYIKMYPTATSSDLSGKIQEWSGTGFALNNGYVVTNYHVVEDAKSITISGINGDFNTSFMASVVASDKVNDLAIVKVNDSRFSGFGFLPYKIEMQQAEVGEDVFVLGYPLTQTMGDEIKLTNGIISSRTGYQGDVSLYQMSAPIQPGNSGGPMFDSKGNIIGIVCAHHRGTENVGYAIKTSYLKNLAESASLNNIFPSTNSVSTLSLSGQVKKLRNFVYKIDCSSQEYSHSYSSSNSTPSHTPSSSSSSHTSNFTAHTGSKFYPQVTKCPSNLTVKHVSTSTSCTAVEILSAPYGNVWCSIDDNTYISANGTQYKLVRAEGISISPQVTNYNGYSITFTLYFPPIPSATIQIDLIEPDLDGWKIYGIQLQ